MIPFFHIILFFYISKSAIVETKANKNNEVVIEPIHYGSENYFTSGVRKSIICKGINKNQKVTQSCYNHAVTLTVNYESNEKYLKSVKPFKMLIGPVDSCRYITPNIQENVEWVDPAGKVVSRDGTKRIFAQEHFVPSQKSRVPALVLTLTRALVGDTGVWTCRSGNEHRQVSLCVIDPAEFVSTATEITADRGRSITLSCQARGDPEPRIVWRRNGDIISDETNPMKYKIMRKYSHEGFEGLLTIVALDSLDSGVYSCGSVQEHPVLPECALNEYLNITLHVNYPPFFDIANETALVPGIENESVNLNCSANGYPAPKYRWFKDIGDLLTEYSKNESQNKDGTSVLAVTANESTFGQRYICRAANQFGVVEKTFEIYKMGPPEKPCDVFVKSVTDNYLQLKISWNDLVKFPIDEIHIQYKECKDVSDESSFDFGDAKNIRINDVVFDRVPQSFDSVVSAVIKDLSEETNYCIRARASNEVGVSPWSEVAVALTTRAEVESLEEHKSEPIVSLQSNTTFYGILFGCGIGIVAVAYMFAIRLV